MNFFKKIQPLERREEMDVLLALQRLEDQEQTKEQEFFRITEQIQKFEMEGAELETKLPRLLKTKRERALYDALLLIFRAKRERFIEYEKQVHARTREIEALKHEFSGIF